MDEFGDKSSYTIPIYLMEQANDLKKIEAEANAALKQIRAIYTEVMQPTNHDEFEFKLGSESSNSRNSTPIKTQKKCTDKLNNEITIQRNKTCIKSKSNQCTSFHQISLNDTYANVCLHNQIAQVKLNNETTCSNYDINRATNSKSEIKITVPQPFSLSGYDSKRLEAKKLKLAKLKNELDCQTQRELDVKINSRPVPKHTYLPLYNAMVEKDEKKKTERKKKCLEVLGKNTTSLQFSKACYDSSEPKSMLETTNDKAKVYFKATPIPKSVLSEKVSQKLKNKEEIRKVLIAHRAEEMLKQASSPITKKNLSRSYSMLNLNDCKKDNNIKEGTKTNIAAITNRLYVKKCKETIENWDDKVRKYSPQDKDFKLQKSISKICPEQKFPFLYYPVRMSNAASLRDKQIRSEILARNKREQEQINNKESCEIHNEISRKLQKLVPVIDSQKEVEEKVKSFRESQLNRKLEYEKELEEIMRRVSQQYLLIERQSKKEKQRPSKSKKDISKDKTVNSPELSSDIYSKSDQEYEPSSEPEKSDETESDADLDQSEN